MNMPKGTLRGKGPGALAQIVEITSGRAIFQQGLTATCKDLPYRETEIGKEEFGLSHEPVRALKEGQRPLTRCGTSRRFG